MRLLALLAAALLSTLVLAGCSDNGGGGGTTSTTTTTAAAATTTTSRSATTTTTAAGTTSSAPQDRAPTGSASAVVNGTAVAFELNGTDPDGDALSWTLAFGDGASTEGTALPATADHTYAVGNFTATFTVSDAAHDVRYDLNVSIAPGGQAINIALGVGTYCTFCELPPSPAAPPAPLPLTAANCFAWQAPAEPPVADCAFAPLDASAAGKAFTATSDVGDPDVEFYADCTAPEPGTPGLAVFLNSGPEAGVVPAGAGCVVAWLFFLGDVVGDVIPPGDVEGGTILVTIG